MITKRIDYSGSEETIVTLNGLMQHYLKKTDSSLKIYPGVRRIVCEGSVLDLLDCYKFVLDAKDALNKKQLEVNTHIEDKGLNALCLGLRGLYKIKSARVDRSKLA